MFSHGSTPPAAPGIHLRHVLSLWVMMCGRCVVPTVLFSCVTTWYRGRYRGRSCHLSSDRHAGRQGSGFPDWSAPGVTAPQNAAAIGESLKTRHGFYFDRFC